MNERMKCPHCAEESSYDTWEETEVGCEDCGTHPAVRCPACGEAVDAIYNDDAWAICYG